MTQQAQRLAIRDSLGFYDSCLVMATTIGKHLQVLLYYPLPLSGTFTVRSGFKREEAGCYKSPCQF